MTDRRRLFHSAETHPVLPKRWRQSRHTMLNRHASGAQLAVTGILMWERPRRGRIRIKPLSIRHRRSRLRKYFSYRKLGTKLYPPHYHFCTLFHRLRRKILRLYRWQMTGRRRLFHNAETHPALQTQNKRPGHTPFYRCLLPGRLY